MKRMQCFASFLLALNMHKGLCNEFFSPKIRDYYVSGWVGPGLTRNLCVCGKSSQISPKPVLIFLSSIYHVYYVCILYPHC